MLPDNEFDLTATNYIDTIGNTPLVKMFIRVYIEWCSEYLVIEGAQKVDFTPDEEYTVTHLWQCFADVLNQYTKGFNEWKVNETQSIFQKAFTPFGLLEGQVFKEYGLVYVFNNTMFFGSARNVDEPGFDKEENRPTNLQILLIKV